jgi:thymidine kinase
MGNIMDTMQGKLEVICGSMFSGKSEELIRRIRRAEFAQVTTQVFKPSLDNRTATDHVNAHSGDKLPAISVDHPEELRTFVLETTQIIGIDEVQFFSYGIVPVVNELIQKGKRVVVAGLDLDFCGTPFGCMPALLALADEVVKLKAVCMCCGKDAQYSQRLVNGTPAKYSDPLIMIGARESYEARCRSCYRTAC